MVQKRLNQFNLNNRTILITGASRGIGAATANRLAEYGAKVVLTARTIEQIQKNASDIKQRGFSALAIQCDVSQYNDVKNAVDLCVSEFGSLDVLVNNAGTIDPISHLVDSDPKAWSEVIDINYKGVYYAMHAALPVMLEQQAGTVINMSSGAANSALEGWSHYCSTKAAVKKLTECGHKEVGDKGINIVGLSPGTVATDMMSNIKESGINPVSKLDWSSHIPADWVAEAIAYLCTSAASDFAGTDFSLKTNEGRKLVGLPDIGS